MNKIDCEYCGFFLETIIINMDGSIEKCPNCGERIEVEAIGKKVQIHRLELHTLSGIFACYYKTEKEKRKKIEQLCLKSNYESAVRLISNCFTIENVIDNKLYIIYMLTGMTKSVLEICSSKEIAENILNDFNYSISNDIWLGELTLSIEEKTIDEFMKKNDYTIFPKETFKRNF